MCGNNCAPKEGLLTRFSVLHKLYFRTAFFGALALGTYGIYTHNPSWAYIYIALGLFCVWVLNWSLCVHCPYPTKYQTCVFQPYQLVLKFFPYKGPRMSLIKKRSFPLSLLGTLGLPYFWIAGDIPLVIIYSILFIALPIGFIGHLCRKCQHVDCPSNLLSPKEKEVLLKRWS